MTDRETIERLEQENTALAMEVIKANAKCNREHELRMIDRRSLVETREIGAKIMRESDAAFGVVRVVKESLSAWSESKTFDTLSCIEIMISLKATLAKFDEVKK
jgi:hypothetical protein